MNFSLKLSALIEEKMKKLYRSIFIKFMVIKQTHLFQSWMDSSYGDIKLILNTTYEELLWFYHSNETSWRELPHFTIYLWGFYETVRIISLVTVLFRRVKASEVGETSKTRAEGIQNTVIV